MSLIQSAAQSVSSWISKPTDFIDNLSNKWIVRPKGLKGLASVFVFDYEGRHQVNLQAQITDHITENNVAIEDHVALQPIRITLDGFVAEVVMKKPEGLLGAIDVIQSKLGVLPAYLGNNTPAMAGKIQKVLQQTTSVINRVNQTIQRAKNVLSFFTGSGDTKQEKAYANLSAAWFTRQLFLVDSPFGPFDNMIIEGLAFIQDETTKSWSDITITLKQMNFAVVEAIGVDPNLNRSIQQAQKALNVGRTAGTPVAQPTSVLAGLFGGQ